MQVQNIQSTNFEKRSFISPQARENLANLINKMEKESVYPHKEDLTDAVIVTSLKVNNGPILSNYLTNYETHFLKGKNLELDLVINNETGEITKEKKPFFSRIKNFIPDIEETINIANENYENPDIVQKLKLKMPNKEFWEKLERLADAASKLADGIDEYLKTSPFFRWFS